MKAISLWQPWATLIAIGAKRFETRSWASTHRGPLLICASKAWKPECDFALLHIPDVGRALRKAGCMNLPRGCAVCLVDLVDCRRTEEMPGGEIFSDLPFGDFSPGRYAWKLENVRPLHPFPVRGRQGLFDVQMPGEFPE